MLGPPLGEDALNDTGSHGSPDLYGLAGSLGAGAALRASGRTTTDYLAGADAGDRAAFQASQPFDPRFQLERESSRARQTYPGLLRRGRRLAQRGRRLDAHGERPGAAARWRDQQHQPGPCHRAHRRRARARVPGGRSAGELALVEEHGVDGDRRRPHAHGDRGRSAVAGRVLQGWPPRQPQRHGQHARARADARGAGAHGVHPGRPCGRAQPEPKGLVAHAGGAPVPLPAREVPGARRPLRYRLGRRCRGG